MDAYFLNIQTLSRMKISGKRWPKCEDVMGFVHNEIQNLKNQSKAEKAAVGTERDRKKKKKPKTEFHI